ncbi:MAG: transposase [Bacteroidetes bacterium]|nr:transposase [Bacteroidota bacterium]
MRWPESKTGKAKGGIKMHTMINANEPVPRVIYFTDAAHHDQQMYKHLNFKSGHIYVFDKEITIIPSSELFNDKDIGYVNPLKRQCSLRINDRLGYSMDSCKSIIKDQIVELPIRKNGQVVRTITGRLVTFGMKQPSVALFSLTNQIELEAIHAVEVYKQRWQTGTTI